MIAGEKYDLVIVGGGGGGLLLAILLGRKGLRVALLEQKKILTYPPRGEMIQPGGLKILDNVGLLKGLLSCDPHQNRRVHFYQSEGNHICTIDYQRLLPPYDYSLILLPRIIQDLFLKEVAAWPNVEIISGASFQSILREGNAVTGVVLEQEGERRNMYAQVVVGADGALSPFRSALFIPYNLHHYQDGYLTALLPRSQDFLEEARYYLGKRKILGLFPVSSQTLYLFYMIQKDQIGLMRDRPFSSFKEQLCSINPGLEKPLMNLKCWEDTAFMPCFRVRCARWVSDGAVLMGDAAHAMNPHVAQGRNAAMEDAVILADVLLDCFQKGNFSQKALAKYEATRRPPVTILQRLGDEMTFFWNSGIAPLVWARNQSLEALHSNTTLHDKTLKTIAGIEVASMTFWDRVLMLNP
ncbi:MAG: FAD-dependent monooxygenase [Nitrospirae bacterium]|nr:FAD-dependent monooxygenase [Candidatus Troglogloeales bacterium]